ncbi:MAG: DUF2828 family protein [Peptostreptococcaceae bacterium]|nr:DUF2828 family protein [Peptostreptococcaceae bacterium]
MSIIKNIRKELNHTFTENLDQTFRSTLDANLDFFGIAGASRYSPHIVERLFREAFDEDPVMAVKNMFYLRDVRGGLGERRGGRISLSEFIQQDLDQAVKFIPYIVEYGRWDDLMTYLYYEGTAQPTADHIKAQLEKDLELFEQGKSISLCSKWMPSINASSALTRSHAKKLISLMKMTAKEYRQLLSKLRKGKIVERNLTERDYSFEYEKLPAKAMNKYQEAFRRNDQEKYLAYLDRLVKGEVQAKVRTLHPYEILKMVFQNEPLGEAQWKAIERKTDTGNTIVVRDGSGSMTCTPNVYETATSLAILFSEQLSGEFKNKFITFSSRPKLVELPDGAGLRTKAMICQRYDDCSNTDIRRVYDLLLESSKKITDPKDYITRIVIISDMEFDAGTCNVPTYEEMKNKFENEGIPLPELVFWNVDARRVHFAADKDDPNVRFVSGLSGKVIETIIDNKAIDPVDFMKQTLARYDFVKEVMNS